MSTEQAGGGDGVIVADSPQPSNGTASNGESQRPISPKTLFGSSAETPKEKLTTPNGEQKSTDEAMEVDEPKEESKETEAEADEIQKEVEEEPKEADGEQPMTETVGEEETKEEEQRVVDSTLKDEEGQSEVEAEKVLAVSGDAEAKEDEATDKQEAEEPSADIQQDEPQELKEEQPEEQPEEGEEEEKPIASTRSRRSAAKPAAATPKPKTPARNAKVTPKIATPAVKATAKASAKETVETPGTSATPRRSSRNAKSKAVAEEAQSTPADSKTPPITSRAGHRSAARRKSVVIVEEPEEGEEEEEEEKEATPPLAPDAEPNGRTPKTTGQVRKPKSATRSSKAKGRGRQSEPAYNPDPEDPFNFDSHSNDHPKPFGVLKGDFGSMKFVRSPEVTQSLENRYAKTEQAASRYSTQTTLTSGTTNTSTTSLSALSTTPSARKDLETPASSKRGGRKAKTEVDVFTPTTLKNQTPSRRKKQGESNVDLLPKKPKAEIKRSQLSAFEQKGVDFVSHEPYPQGTRVFALWGREFYPAYIFDRDALGRYKVIFAEDEQTKDVPGTGIIPLAKVTKGKQVAVIMKTGEGEMEIPVEILHMPSPDDADEWTAGEYEIREAENEEAEVQRVPWTKLLITKLQQKDVMAVKNVVVDVATDNVVPRSARRSRVAANTAIHEQQHPTHVAKSTPSSQRSTKSGISSSAAPQTPKTHSRTPSKRPRTEETDESESPKPKRKTAESQAEEKPMEEPIPEEKEEQMAEEEEVAEEEMETEQTDEKNLFSGFYFMLTSSARRPSNVTQFNKRECKLAIEERGGVVVEEIDEILDRPEGVKAFLVADTYYRTHKYLFALAASVPTVHHRWVEECLKEKKILDHVPHLLPAGSSILDGKEYPWKPLKGQLMKDKIIFVHSVAGNPNQSQVNVVPFAAIWRPVLNTLGATIITCETNGEDEVIEFMDNNPFDLMLADSSCRPRIIAHAEAKGCQAVSSNWIIHTIVTTKEANVADHPSFSPLA